MGGGVDGGRLLTGVPVVGFAVLTFVLTAGVVYGPRADVTTATISLAESVAVVVAMFRPVPAWWAAILASVAGVLVAGPPFPWGFFAILPVAGVLFLLALRVRPWAVLGSLTTGVLVILAATGFRLGDHPAYGLTGLVFSTDPGRAGLVLTIAAGTGALWRARRVARARLAAQKALAAEERALRAVLEERGRIARELHDVVAHHLSVISIQAQVAPHLVGGPPAELRENLTSIRQSARDALTELRRVLGVLRLEGGAEETRHAPQPTLERVDELIGNVRAAGVAVTIEITGPPRPLSPGIELSAYRIVQEALSNAMRHAPGAAVRVLIAYHPSGVTVRIGNSAPARPGQPSAGVGHGLLGMRERTAMLDGDLAAGPTPDGGYEVTAMLPAPAPQPAEAQPAEARP